MCHQTPGRNARETVSWQGRGGDGGGRAGAGAERARRGGARARRLRRQHLGCAAGGGVPGKPARVRATVRAAGAAEGTEMGWGGAGLHVGAVGAAPGPGQLRRPGFRI